MTSILQKWSDQITQFISTISTKKSKKTVRIQKVPSNYLKLTTKGLEYGEITYNLAGPMGIIDGDMVPVFQGQFFGNLHGNAFYSTPVIGGSSGSPIVNFKGELVGMIHSVHYRFHHLTLSATYERLWNFLNVEKVRIIQVQN